LEIAKRLRIFYLAYLSYPSSDRLLYRLVVRHPPRNILEIGLGRGMRAARLLELICGQLPADQVCYTGIDLFEARPLQFGQKLPLKRVYQTLRQTGANIRLYPGDPYTVLSQRANQLGPIDWLIVSASFDPQSLAKAWFYIPRMLHPESLVWVEERAGKKSWFRQLPASSVDQGVQSRPIPKAA
jgi:hypothetical protein